MSDTNDKEFNLLAPLLDALSRIKFLNDYQNRTRAVEFLQIEPLIDRSSVKGIDIHNIVQTCLSYGYLSKLLEIIEQLDTLTIPLEEAKKASEFILQYKPTNRTPHWAGQARLGESKCIDQLVDAYQRESQEAVNAIELWNQIYRIPVRARQSLWKSSIT